MAALTITAGSVVPGTGATIENSTAGATITAGQLVYLDTTTSTMKLADANGAAALRSVYGIALNGASSGQPVSVLTKGNITIGATVVTGTIYVSGATSPGDINPAADLTTGWYTSVIGVATSTTVIAVQIQNSGAVN